MGEALQNRGIHAVSDQGMTPAPCGAMIDARWTQLRQILVECGWVWRDNTLFSPNETMWFTASTQEPDHASFRDRMTEAMCATADDPEVPDPDRVALHQDLCSLVAALDAILDGN